MSFFCKHTCIFCDSATNRKIDLCIACEQELPFLKNCCIKCARELTNDQKICGACLNKSSINIEIKVFFDYKNPIDQIIINLKFHKNLVKARALSELVAGYLHEHYKRKTRPEIIIPVPLHKARLRERAYNQALEITRPIAKKLNIPIDRFSVVRKKNTQAQAKLSLKEREQNIKNAFCVKKSFDHKYVAVVDDVITTGNTIKELCKMLQKAGVDRIDVWCLAKKQ